MPIIEVLHERDPDSECSVRVFVNGVETTSFMVDVDPGRGHLLSDWRESKEYAVENAATEASAAAVAEAYDAGEENQYVEDDT